jgi:hypothetical protein
MVRPAAPGAENVSEPEIVSGPEAVDTAGAEPAADPAPAPPTTDPQGTEPDGGTGGGTSRRGLLTPGGTWGRWTLRKRIRTGGFAQVWRATDADGERAAMKFLLRPDAEVEAKRFRRERDLGARLEGKWLPKVLDSDLGDFVPWIAFEYLDFPALDQLVAASGPLTGEALVIFTRDLWDAVLSLHQHDVAHRDLSARNVLIDVDDGRLRLIDLGSGLHGDGTLITQEVFPASMGFAAPEQFEVRESRVGPAADVWSWAAVVYYAAVGATLFPVEPRIAFLDALRARTAPDLTRVPENLRPALAAALRYDPAERHPAAVTAALPLRTHEAALRAAEERLARADAETWALRAAVAEANQRLERSGTDAGRIDQLVAQAQQAAADAAEARRQLEQATVAARRATGATARVTELRESLEGALRQRDQALGASDARVRELEGRLRQADAELARLRGQANSAPQRWHPGVAAGPAPTPPPVVRGTPLPAAPGHAPAAPAPPRRRTLLARSFSALLTCSLVLALFVLVSANPVLSRPPSRLESGVLFRVTAATTVTLAALVLALLLASFAGFRQRGRPERGLWVYLLVAAPVVLALAYLDPFGVTPALDRAVGSIDRVISKAIW